MTELLTLSNCFLFALFSFWWGFFTQAGKDAWVWVWWWKRNERK